LYKDGDEFVFMDTDTYEQINVKPATLGDVADYLVESATAQIALYGTEIVAVEIPASVELTIAQTEPGIQGDRVSGARKPATLQTGKVIQVPLFINTGDRVKVDTRTGDYVTRV
ncbi:MAG: elongation factor P, partial [Ilumatobacteraceae bacterium]